MNKDKIVIGTILYLFIDEEEFTIKKKLTEANKKGNNIKRQITRDSSPNIGIIYLTERWA